MSRSVVTRAHVPKHRDPIRVRSGDRVAVGEPDEEYPGWRWCLLPDGKGGFVPEAILGEVLAGRAGVLEDYDATELDVAEGEELEVLRRLAGWCLTVNRRNERGWIPESSLEDVTPSPWLSVPPEDYEGHMGSPEVGQLEFLSGVFRDLLREIRPEAVAVLGCATGNGFEHFDPSVTRTTVGIDIHPGYLEVLRRRHDGRLPGLKLIRADVAECALAPRSFDLVHAALFLEYAEPSVVLARAGRWLKPGGFFSTVLQLPASSGLNVSATRYETVKLLEPAIRLVAPRDLRREARCQGFEEVRSDPVTLASGKAFLVGVFRSGHRDRPAHP